MDKESALIYLRFAEKLTLLVEKYSRAREVDNLIREKNYYAHIVQNPPETPLFGLTTYAGMIKRIPFPMEPTIALMLSGKGATLDTDFYLQPLEVYYIIADAVKEVSEDARIKVVSGGFQYIRPRVGTPIIDLFVDSIDKLAMLIVLDLKKMCEANRI